MQTQEDSKDSKLPIKQKRRKKSTSPKAYRCENIIWRYSEKVEMESLIMRYSTNKSLSEVGLKPQHRSPWKFYRKHGCCLLLHWQPYSRAWLDSKAKGKEKDELRNNLTRWKINRNLTGNNPNAEGGKGEEREDEVSPALKCTRLDSDRVDTEYQKRHHSDVEEPSRD